MAKQATQKKGMAAFEQALKPKAATPSKPTLVTSNPNPTVRDGSATSAWVAKRKAARAGKPVPDMVGGYPSKAIITILKDEGGKVFDNPHRAAGGGRMGAWNAMAKCKTVGDYWYTGEKEKYLTGWATGKMLKDGVRRIKITG